MGFIILTSGLFLYFGTSGGIKKCGEKAEPQRMYFFTEAWIADCSTINTWYTFGIISAIVGTLTLIATLVAKFT